MNPFSVKSYRGPDYFIDRENETRKLLDAINSERNLTLFSHRRLGKTMLIHHAFSKLDPKIYTPVFVDLFATKNLVQFAQKITEVLYHSGLLKESRLNQLLGSMGVSLSFDPVNGAPKVNFSLTNPETITRSLPQIFNSIRELKRKVVIAFDEFQEVARYEEDNSEAVIRTLMQDFPEITFLFSGSKKSLMKEIFSNANRPFFQSTQMMELYEIDREIYAGAVCKILRKFEKSFDDEVIFMILDITYCHTGFTQMVLSRVFSESGLHIDSQVFDQVWSDILEDHKSMARELEFLLPKLQWKSLVAISKEEFVKAPQSIEFINKHQLSSPSSMARAIHALLEKGLIIESGEKGLRLYNVFVQRNLQLLYQ